MEAYLALFEPDRKAGGCVVTFPDFGYGVTQDETDEEGMGMAPVFTPASRLHVEARNAA